MHQQYNAVDKKFICKDFIEALEKCHAGLGKWVGACNQQKLELNKCLHGVSMKRRENNSNMAKERALRVQQAKDEFYSEN
ncbi:hypothetical protein DL96DRAFT_1711872 [Flagelloscypha sp. PMI_526]|nr:hypothetical protein DL96DRAFT_1711872 [Flagelloscypha sp. PMI_526]